MECVAKTYEQSSCAGQSLSCHISCHRHLIQQLQQIHSTCSSFTAQLEKCMQQAAAQGFASTAYRVRLQNPWTEGTRSHRHCTHPLAYLPVVFFTEKRFTNFTGTFAGPTPRPRRRSSSSSSESAYAAERPAFLRAFSPSIVDYLTTGIEQLLFWQSQKFKGILFRCTIFAQSWHFATTSVSRLSWEASAEGIAVSVARCSLSQLQTKSFIASLVEVL